MDKKRIVIALEGIPGAGKTTIMERLRNDYGAIDGIDQILPRDLPDETITLPKILESDQLKTLSINKSLAPIIVLDRYYQSTLAYHWAYDRVFGEREFSMVQDWKEKALETKTLTVPDYTFFIDVDPVLSTQRKNRELVNYGTKAWIRNDFLISMRQYYVNLTNDTTENCILIDGRATIEDMIATILNVINFNSKDLYEKK